VIYVIGVFDCGCYAEFEPSSTEIVKCNTEQEAFDVISKFEIHSVDNQCHPREYTDLIIISDGELKTKNKFLFTYEEFLKKWSKRNKKYKKEGELK